MEKKIYLCVLTCFAFGLFSCQNEENFFDESNFRNNVTKPTESNEIYYVTKMAEFLNKAIQDPSILEALKKEARNQIDGDYDVLLAQALAVTSTRNESNLLTTVTNKISDDQPSSIDEFMALVDGFKRDAPLLNIYMPDDQDFAMTDDFLTVILEPSFNDCKDHKVNALNRNGDIIVLSADKEPTIPYMVIGINERITLEPEASMTRSSQSAIFSNEYHSYYLPDRFNQKKRDSSTPQTRSLSYRNGRITSDVISRAKFKSSDAIKAVEKWFRGAPEVHLTVIYADNSPMDIITGPLLHNIQHNLGENGWYTGSRRKKKPCDNYGNWSIIDWQHLQKKYMKYHFHEMDNKFKVTIAGWEVQFSGGDNIGDCKVNYSDALGATYHINNMFEFDVK